MTTSDTQLRDAIAKIMAMAGTDGDAYAPWTVNQISFGLKHVVPGANSQRIEAQLRELEQDGLVRLASPGSRNNPARWVRTKRIPAPEPFERSPFAKPDDDTDGVDVIEAREASVDEVREQLGIERMSSESVDHIRLMDRLAGLEAIAEPLLQRVGNLEDVVGTLNDQIASMKIRFDKQREKLEPKVSELSLDAGFNKKRLETMKKDVDTIMQVFENIVKMDDVGADDGDGVQVVAHPGLGEHPEIGKHLHNEQLETLVKYWTGLAVERVDDTPRSVAEASVYRACADDLQRVLSGTRIFVKAGD
jgi:hypothetical protein